MVDGMDVAGKSLIIPTSKGNVQAAQVGNKVMMTDASGKSQIVEVEEFKKFLVQNAPQPTGVDTVNFTGVGVANAQSPQPKSSNALLLGSLLAVIGGGIYALTKGKAKINNLAAQLTKTEGQLGKVETQLAKAEGQLGKVETQLTKAEGQLSKANQVAMETRAIMWKQNAGAKAAVDNVRNQASGNMNIAVNNIKSKPLQEMGEFYTAEAKAANEVKKAIKEEAAETVEKIAKKSKNKKNIQPAKPTTRQLVEKAEAPPTNAEMAVYSEQLGRHATNGQAQIILQNNLNNATIKAEKGLAGSTDVSALENLRVQMIEAESQAVVASRQAKIPVAKPKPTNAATPSASRPVQTIMNPDTPEKIVKYIEENIALDKWLAAQTGSQSMYGTTSAINSTILSSGACKELPPETLKKVYNMLNSIENSNPAWVDYMKNFQAQLETHGIKLVA